MRTRISLTLLVFSLAALPLRAQELTLPPGDDRPLLRLEGGGPAGNVTALVFSPDGKKLFAAGFDKVVRVWVLNGKTGKFELDVASSYRVPIGPGTRGAINALALSADGSWLAVGGLGIVRGGVEFHNDFGKLWPALGAMTAAMRLDEGLIYVFHTGKRDLRLLRGHTGAVESLTFAPSQKGKALLLVSTARGWDVNTLKKTGEVRVWDVAKEESIAARSDLPFPKAPPGLAAFHTGDQPKDLRVALAWGDQSLRLWDVAAADGKMAKVADGAFNTPLVLHPDRKKVLTTSFRGNRSGRLQLWDVTGAAPTAVEGRGVSFDPADGVFSLPRALGFVAVEEGPYAAVVFRTQSARTKAEAAVLQLVDLRPDSFGTRTKAVPLWDDTSMMPVLAASPDGRRIAVAGNPDHTIRIFAVAGLLQGAKQPQVLASAGLTMRSVAFVRAAGKKGNRLGLRLGDAAGQPGALVFDFEKGALTANVQGWADDNAEWGNWQVFRASAVDGRTVLLTVMEGGQQRARLDRGRGKQIVDVVAFLPPALAPKVPLVAVAAYDFDTGEPLLDLYHAVSGDHLRRLTGHLARIRGLAFSKDGRLLASVADDQTTSVWSLTNLGEVLGKFGQVPGVAVRQDGKDKVVVAKVEEGSPATGKLRVEDVVEGVVSKGKLQALKSPDAFYDAAVMVKPGQPITLRVRSEGGKSRDVELTAGQGVDVRMPLLTLFVTRAAPGKERDWLGWNPTGPFDSNRAQVEKYAGWHRNTGKKENPTTFALLEEYRKKYRTPGILNRLMMKGNLRDALAEAPRPMPIPHLTALVGDAPADAAKDGQVFVRQHEGVRVELAIQDYTSKSGDLVEWQLDDGKPQPFGPTQGGRWVTPALPLPARGGIHTVRAIVRFPADQGPAQESRGVLTLRYQPPAPAIESPLPTRRVIDTDKFAFVATVHPGQPGPQVRVTLVHRFGKQEKKQTYLVGQGVPLKLTGVLTLGEGVNLITLSAENKDPLPNYEENERVVRAVEIRYEKKPVPRPVITLEPIQPLSRVAVMPPAKIVPGQPVLVDVPRVRLTGRIKAEANLEQVQRLSGGDGPAAKLTGFKPGSSKEYAIDETLDLKPGAQTFRIVAKAAGSKEEAEETVVVFYRPQLPRLEWTAPERGTVLYETKDGQPGQVRVTGKLLPPPDPSPEPFPLKAAVFIKDRQVLAPTVFKAGVTEVEFPKVALEPGDNLVQIELSHEWGGKRRGDSLEVRYLRPPRILELTKDKVAEKPFVDLVSKVYSPLPLRGSVRVEVVNAEGKKAPVRLEANIAAAQGLIGVQVQPATEPRVWEVRLKEVPLPAKTNSVRLWVSNADGESRQAGLVEKVVYVPPLPPPPQVALLEPGAGAVMLAEPKVVVRFRVKSEAPLKRVVLLKGKQELFNPAPAVVANMKPGAQGFVEFRTEPLLLDWGLNDLRVEALAEGGLGQDAVTLNLMARPVELELHLLQTQLAKGVTVRPELKDGALHFPDVGHGRVWLHGTVRWSSKDDERMTKVVGLRTYVNGFLQVAAKLDAPTEGGRERKFKADLLLPPGLNKVEVVLPDLEQDARNRREFAVVRQGSWAPQEPRPHLHVVLIAPDHRQGQSLKSRLLEALQASAFGPDLYRTKAFEQVRVQVLSRDVAAGDVYTHMRQVERALRQRADNRAPNDVVMVYYLGQQTVNVRERFYWTSYTRPGAQIRSTALNLQFLADTYFDRFAGAQILLLDVTAAQPAATSRPLESQGAEDRWPNDYRFAILRHTWSSKASGADDAALLKGLEQTLPKASGLRELDNALRNLFPHGPNQVNRGPGWFDEHLPRPLRIRLDRP